MIRKVSIPLVVGMIVAAGVGPSEMLSSLSLAASSALLLFYAFSRVRSGPVPAALFFFLGLFCRSSCSLVREMPWHIAPMTGWLEKSVDAVPFTWGETGALAKALLAGKKELLPPQTIEAFRNAGAAHILALSGFHLGIIYAFISGLFSIAGNSMPVRRLRCVLTTVLALLYVLMTGAGPSIVRAFLFIFLNEAGRLHPERRRDSLSIFWTALTIQLVLDPLVLDSTGFRLSYLAMLGIFTVYPRMRDWYPAGFGLMRYVWNSAALSFSCQLFTAPLVYVTFGTFPKYFLLTNLIAMPLTTLFVTVVLCCIISTPPGLCPAALVRFADMLARALASSLEIISGM